MLQFPVICIYRIWLVSQMLNTYIWYFMKHICFVDSMRSSTTYLSSVYKTAGIDVLFVICLVQISMVLKWPELCIIVKDPYVRQ